ncbi:CAAD domain-containing protein [Alkalinema sp. FACHB-956]|uniref:CAAD domain-containing protein n=1 Tax=Alkalinema sp. FACHB-956 TaxID=2692768 RepID=UPI001685D86A|nr:CAAD domain-containing protein [Alkalinema sp. FACHB-956]MBD2328936.1 CAAD domain-containing protein [Alkalinema sp. FACHB-956]
METELQQAESTAQSEATISLEDAGTLAQLSSSNETSEQVKEVLSVAYEILSNLPERLGEFFTEYKQLMVTLGLIFGSIVAVKLTLALLAALNEIPLVEPVLELIGLGYSTWFIIRFMLKAEKRQEFYVKFNDTKDQVLGSK